MLPILLYNNMEGGSNSMNNSPNSSYSGVYDESVILNCVRNRRKAIELPNCPVCSCTIRNGELDSHLALEVERLQKLSAGGSKRKLSATSSPNLAVPGSSTDTYDDVVDDQEVDVSGCLGSDVYQRVHSNRLRRLRARRRTTPPPSQGECPVCNTTLPTSKLQRHALRCLKRTGAVLDEDVPDTSSEEGSIDVENDSPAGFGAEYQWCGEWRVRASALQQQQARAPAAAARRDDHDLALVVDGDEDAELYGPPQYSPSRIAADIPEAYPYFDNVMMQVLQKTLPIPINGYYTEAEIPDGHSSEEIDAETLSDSSQDIYVKHKPNGLVEASAETRIQALKEKIKDLEKKQNSATEAKCLICLGPYSSPAVSIQCWHVYCEVCWLQSLKAKKICPQCNAITTSMHLRRIYM